MTPTPQPIATLVPMELAAWKQEDGLEYTLQGDPMGRSILATFVVDYQDQLGWHRVIWNVKDSGKPTDANLEAWRKTMNASMKTGGCNEHVSKATGFIPHVSKAIIRNQKTGNINVANAKAPMFEVL